MHMKLEAHIPFPDLIISINNSCHYIIQNLMFCNLRHKIPWYILNDTIMLQLSIKERVLLQFNLNHRLVIFCTLFLIQLHFSEVYITYLLLTFNLSHFIYYLLIKFIFVKNSNVSQQKNWKNFVSYLQKRLLRQSFKIIWLIMQSKKQ